MRHVHVLVCHNEVSASFVIAHKVVLAILAFHLVGVETQAFLTDEISLVIIRQYILPCCHEGHSAPLRVHREVVDVHILAGAVASPAYAVDELARVRIEHKDAHRKPVVHNEEQRICHGQFLNSTYPGLFRLLQPEDIAVTEQGLDVKRVLHVGLRTLPVHIDRHLAFFLSARHQHEQQPNLHA